MLQKLMASTLALGTALSVTAQDSTKNPLNITGFVDVYYRYDFAEKGNNKTSFTNSHNSFEFGMASVKIDKTIGKVGFVADLGFGKRATEFSYNDDGILAAVKQAYITYAPTEKLKFTAGSFATHVGYELVDAPANRNYSMSYMFSYGPFFHTGIKADVTLGNFGLMAGLVNPTDFKYVSTSPKTFIAQASAATKSGKFKAYLNFLSGRQAQSKDFTVAADTAKVVQTDLVITASVSDKFSLGFNGTVGSKKFKKNNKYGDGQTWWGSALYLNFDPSAKFGLTLRGELFDDDKGLFGVLGTGNVFATTLSAGFTVVGGLKIIPELRYEAAKNKVFLDKDGAATKNAFSAVVAAVYSFSN